MSDVLYGTTRRGITLKYMKKIRLNTIATPLAVDTLKDGGLALDDYHSTATYARCRRACTARRWPS